MGMISKGGTSKGVTSKGRTIRYFTAIAALGLVWLAPSAQAGDPQAEIENNLKRAHFAREHATSEVRHLADWVVDSGDSQGMPFVLIDKQNAKLYVFNADGRVRGAAPVLLGLARGDDSVPGIGERELRDIPPHDRTTPAGRFVAEIGRNFSGKEIVWVDYASAVSMHRVVKGTPQERRAQRLASPTSADNRISYGCINVPVKFFDAHISPVFNASKGIVYVLPETRNARVEFGAYDVEERARQRIAAAARAVEEARAATAVSDPAGN